MKSVTRRDKWWLYHDWSTEFGATILVLGLFLQFKVIDPTIILLTASIYYLLDTSKSLYLKIGHPWQHVHHTGAQLVIISLLNSDYTRWWGGTALSSFEITTILFNLSELDTSVTRKMIWKKLFYLSALVCRLGMVLASFPIVYPHLTHPYILVIGTLMIFMHNGAFAYLAKRSDMDKSIDMLRLFGGEVSTPNQ